MQHIITFEQEHLIMARTVLVKKNKIYPLNSCNHKLLNNLNSQLNI